MAISWSNPLLVLPRWIFFFFCFKFIGQHEEKIEEFKDCHKQHEDLAKSQFQTHDIRQDLASMEHEKENMVKQVEKLRRKVRKSCSADVFLKVSINFS